MLEQVLSVIEKFRTCPHRPPFLPAAKMVNEAWKGFASCTEGALHGTQCRFIRRQACFIKTPFQMKHCFVSLHNMKQLHFIPLWSIRSAHMMRKWKMRVVFANIPYQRHLEMPIGKFSAPTYAFQLTVKPDIFKTAVFLSPSPLTRLSAQPPRHAPLKRKKAAG